MIPVRLIIIAEYSDYSLRSAQFNVILASYEVHILLLVPNHSLLK